MFAALACAAVLAMLGAGCGGATDTVTLTRTAPAETTPSEKTPGETNAEETSDDTTAGETTSNGKDDGDDTEVVELTSFRSPSGNIGCVLGDDGVRCDIGDRDWTPPPKPADCMLDWGQGLQASDDSDQASVVCAGDTTLDPGAEVLAYGSAARAGDFTCTSRTAGITCTDDGDGYGFFISKQTYRLF